METEPLLHNSDESKTFRTRSYLFDASTVLSLKNVGAKRAPLPASKGVVVLTEWLLPSKVTKATEQQHVYQAFSC